MSGKPFNSLVVLGATATGKTALAVALARQYGGEIISADSRQVYRGLDIGTGKDLAEYGAVPYHLIDIASLPDEYSVFNYQKDFSAAFESVLSRSRLPVIAGGTGLYLDAVIRSYRLLSVPRNEELRLSLENRSLEDLAALLLTLKKDIHNRTDLLEKERLLRAIEIAEYQRSAGALSPPEENPVIPLIFGMCFERAELRSRIRERLFARAENGLVQEVEAIHAGGISWERLERLGLEYRYTAEYLQGRLGTRAEFLERLCTAICQFAKRQETWFRGMERKGIRINWLEKGNREEAVKMIEAERF